MAGPPKIDIKNKIEEKKGKREWQQKHSLYRLFPLFVPVIFSFSLYLLFLFWELLREVTLLGTWRCHNMIFEQSEGIAFNLVSSSRTTSCTNLIESWNQKSTREKRRLNFDFFFFEKNDLVSIEKGKGDIKLSEGSYGKWTCHHLLWWSFFFLN